MTQFFKIKSKRDLNSCVVLGETCETETLEFKREVNFKKRGIQIEYALDICQFLNSFGGVILIGVEERFCDVLNRKVASRYYDSNYERISQFIYDKVLQYLHPNCTDLSINPINISESISIVAINIQPLINGLACVYEKSPPFNLKYPYRTSYGKKYYSPSEVEKLVSSNNRYISLKLMDIFPQINEIKIYPDLIIEEKDQSVKWDVAEHTCVLKSIGKSEYTLNIAGVDVNIPFSLTKDIWLTEDQKIGLLLNVKLVLSTNRKKICFDLS